MRWTYKRKAGVVKTVRRGDLTKADACKIYDLSLEELNQWEKVFILFGELGLREQKIQQNRQKMAENKK